MFNRGKIMKYFFRLLVLLIGVLFSVLTILWACGGDDDYDYRSWYKSSFIPPEVMIQNKEKNLILSNFTWTSDWNDFAENYRTVYKDKNLKEWEGYFNKKISLDILGYWLYTATLKDVDEMIFTLTKKKTEKKFIIKYNLVNLQSTDKLISFLFYLGFAKRNEVFVLNDIDTWRGKDPVEKPEISDITISKQIEGGLRLFKKEKSFFIKERYIFQLLRLYYFNKEYDKAIHFYIKNKSKLLTGNSMKWRAMGYAAGTYYKNKNYSEANYLYSLIYFNSMEQRKSAYLSFHPQQDKDWEECLALTKSKKEKIILWYLFGMYFDAPKALLEIYKLSPNSEFLEVLFVRRLKQWGNDKFVKPVTLIASENKTQNSIAWNFAAAYVNYYAGNFMIGDIFLNKTKKAKQKNSIYYARFHLLQLYGNLHREQTIDESIEKKFLPDLKILLSLKTSELTLAFYDNEHWIRGRLAELYVKSNQPEKADMVRFGTVQKRFTIENLVARLSYLETDKHSDLEKLFLEKTKFKIEDYILLLGIRYAQADRLEEALETFKRIPNLERTYINPFSIFIRDWFRYDPKKENEIYSDISLIEKMIELKKRAKENKEESAENYFLLANAFYNIGEFGNRSYFHYNKIQNTDFSSHYYCCIHPEDKSSPDLDVSHALKYYLLAKKNSKDHEFKAKATFMAAKCEQKQWFLSKPKESKADFNSGKYFRILKKKYSDTNYFSEILKECSYFSKFVNQSSLND